MAAMFSKCNEIVKWEKDTEKTSPEIPRSPSRKLPPYVFYSNYSHGQFIPPGENKVWHRLTDNYFIPKPLSSTSGCSSTVTSSAAAEDPSTINTTAGSATDIVEAPTSKQGKKTPTSTSDEMSFNTSASVLRRRIEEGLLNRALTLFAPLSMAEDLTKIQFTLCNEIKYRLQAINDTVTAIPFDVLKKEITEASNNLEERMNNLEHKYNKPKEIILHRTTQHFSIDLSLLEK